MSLSSLGALWMVVWLATWTEGPYIPRRSSATAAGIPSEDTEPSVPWRRILLSPHVRHVRVPHRGDLFALTVVLTWLPSYFEVGLGYSALQAGSMFALPSVAGSVPDADHRDHHRDRLLHVAPPRESCESSCPRISVLFGGVTLVFLPQIGIPALAVAASRSDTVVSRPRSPLLNAAISELCPPQQTAGTMGMFLASWRWVD